MLRTLASKPIAASGNDVYSQRDVKSAALYRWYQLDSAGARQQVLDEIGVANPSLDASALWFLSDKSLPQFESLWAQEFLATSSPTTGSLLVRFGTGAAASAIESSAREKIGKWACDPQAIALAYLVKFAPDTALPLLEQALAARGPGKTGCSRSFFDQVGHYGYGPVVTTVSIAALDDEDPDVARSAVQLSRNLRRQFCGEAPLEPLSEMEREMVRTGEQSRRDAGRRAGALVRDQLGSKPRPGALLQPGLPLQLPHHHAHPATLSRQAGLQRDHDR